MKLMKRILIIIAVIVLIVGIWILRNVIIFKKLENSLKPYEKATNYYLKTNMRDINQVYETYRKENQYLTKIRILASNGQSVKERNLMNYGNGETVNTYIHTGEKKVAQLNSGGIPKPQEIMNVFEGMTFWEYLKMATFSTIETEDWNGKDCYKVMLRYSANLMYDENPELWYAYFEKETGLLLKFGMNEYEYQFNVVTDNDLKEPNIENYEVVEN